MDNYFKGRGAQINTHNRFLKNQLVNEHPEGIDEEQYDGKIQTQVFYESAGKVVNKVNSPDVGMMYSVNPYQGCEHGCIYCYARNTHPYWGFSAGLDFESKIVVKKDTPELLEKHLLKSTWRPAPISLSGNTDCYQPLEKKYELTRKCLEILLKYRNPVGMITKNQLITRDLDILQELAKRNLVHVMISITTLDEKLRGKMEPRTVTSIKRFEVMEKLAKAGIPVGLMAAPIIPGLNHHEIPQLIKEAADRGASGAGYTVLRLNGDVSEIFEDWVKKNFPDRSTKVLNQVSELHDGKVNDSVFHRRMTGEGNIATAISDLYRMAKKRYLKGRSFAPYDLSAFRRGGNYQLF